MNFLRCPLLVVALLDQAKELGCLDEVHDEGKFWESREVKALVPEIASWNSLLAAWPCLDLVDRSHVIV